MATILPPSTTPSPTRTASLQNGFFLGNNKEYESRCRTCPFQPGARTLRSRNKPYEPSFENALHCILVLLYQGPRHMARDCSNGKRSSSLSGNASNKKPSGWWRKLGRLTEGRQRPLKTPTTAPHYDVILCSLWYSFGRADVMCANSSNKPNI